MITFLKRIMFLLFFPVKILMISWQGLKEYNKGIIRVKHRLLHDASVLDDELEARLTEEEAKLRESISRDTRQKITDLVKQLEGIS